MEEELLRMMTGADALEMEQKRRDCEHRFVHLTIVDCQCTFCVFCGRSWSGSPAALRTTTVRSEHDDGEITCTNCNLATYVDKGRFCGGCEEFVCDNCVGSGGIEFWCDTCTGGEG